MKKTYLLIFGLLFTIKSLAQSPTYQWAKQITSNWGSGDTKEIITDNNGYVYITGIVQAGWTMDYDPGPGTFNLTANGTSGGFVAKYDPNGNFVWAFLIDGSGTDEGWGIAIDNSSNVFVTGVFQNTIDFDPGPGTANITAGSSSSLYLAKYSSTGTYLGAFQIGDALGKDVAIDASNDVVICGNSGGTVDFDPSPATYNIAGSVGFLAKYSNSLGFIWADGFNSSSSTMELRRIGFDAANKIYICGKFFFSSIDMDPGPSSYLMSTTSVSSGFFAKYNSNGTFRWAVGLTSSNSSGGQDAYDLAIDNNANVYVVGSINQYTVDFDPSPASYILSANGSISFSGFIAKYDSTSAFSWAFVIGASNTSNEFYNVDLDVYNNPIAVGDFKPGTDFDPGASTTTLNINSSGSGCCVKYNPAGNFIYAFSYFTTPTASSSNKCCDVSTNNSLHIFGKFFETVDFDPSASIANLTTSSFGSHQNVFISKYDAGCSSAPSIPGAISGNNTICNGSINTYSVATVAGASSYTWSLPGGWTGTSSTNSINTTASSTSGNLTVTATNACGTSPAQTLSVTVNTIPSTPGTVSGSVSLCTGASATNYSISSVAGATSYSWNVPGGWTGSSTTNIISATPGSSGTFTVKAINSCGTSAAQTLSVTVNPIPAANAGSSQTITCSSNTVTLNGSGVSTYTWSGPGIVSGGNSSSPIVNVAGIYFLSGSTSGCNSNTATVIVSSDTVVPTVTAASSATLICGPPFQGTATITASGASTYSWNTSATTNSISVSPGTTTTYTVIGTATNGCTNVATFTQNVSACTGVEQFVVESLGFAVYPNPTTGFITLTGIKGAGLEIYNSIGQRILKAELMEEKSEIDLNSLPAGIYFVKVDSVIKRISKE